MREQGQLGDWQEADENKKDEIKRQNSEGVLGDQRSSLEQWIDYFASSDSKYIPRELKYWIFRNIEGLQELKGFKSGPVIFEGRFDSKTGERIDT